MKLAKYLHELLLQHETVIVPGFGAFISNYKPSEINKDTNEIMPPSKEISFNQKIRNNDGLLVGYVAETYSVSHFNALKIIEKERENMIYRLDKGEQVTLENIGVLYRNEKNVTELIQHIEENLLLDSFGLESVSLKDEKEEQENKSDDKPLVVPDTEEETQSELNNEENIGESELKEEENHIAEEHANQEDKEVTEDVFEQTSTQEIEEKGNEAIPKFETDPTKEFVLENQPEEKKKRKAWIWFLLILIPLIVAGIFLGKDKFFRNNNDNNIRQSEITESSSAPDENKVISDSMANDSVQVLQVDTTEQTIVENNEAETIKSDKLKFYLVGGSFKEEENASKFIEQFDADGYEPFLLGKRGNFYIVVIGSYSTEREAVLARDSFMTQNPGSEAWVPDDGVFE